MMIPIQRHGFHINCLMLTISVQKTVTTGPQKGYDDEEDMHGKLNEIANLGLAVNLKP